MKNLIKISFILILSTCFTSCTEDSSSTATGVTGNSCGENSTQDTCPNSCTWLAGSLASEGGAQGGLAEASGWMVSYDENTIIGFSVTGQSITEDTGTLVVISSNSTPSSIADIIIAGFPGSTEDLDGDGNPDENIIVTFWDGSGNPPSGNYIYFESVDNSTWNVNFNIIPTIYGIQFDIVFTDGTCS